MQFASLGSGSKGNATLVRNADTCLLVDCGFSLVQFERRLARLCIEPSAIDGLLITHEHSDHAGGIARLLQNYALPVWTTVGTAARISIDRYNVINGGQSFSIGSIDVQAVTVPHDAAEPVQFVFTDRLHSKKLGILTDSGHISNHMLDTYSCLHALLIEFNYDHDMLVNGPYPAKLKRRVVGSHGHLSNQQSIDMLRRIDVTALTCLVAGHISQNNNDPQLVAALLQQHVHHCQAIVACQDDGFDWLQV